MEFRLVPPSASGTGGVSSPQTQAHAVPTIMNANELCNQEQESPTVPATATNTSTKPATNYPPSPDPAQGIPVTTKAAHHPYGSLIPVEFGAPSNHDNDNESFHSCVDDSQLPRELFDQDDLYQFPKDPCVYTVNDPSFRPSWTFVTYSHRGQRIENKKKES